MLTPSFQNARRSLGRSPQSLKMRRKPKFRIGFGSILPRSRSTRTDDDHRSVFQRHRVRRPVLGRAGGGVEEFLTAGDLNIMSGDAVNGMGSHPADFSVVNSVNIDVGPRTTSR